MNKQIMIHGIIEQLIKVRNIRKIKCRFYLLLDMLSVRIIFNESLPVSTSHTQTT